MVLRNVVPRQGTETFILSESLNCFLCDKLRNVVPRQGTETMFSVLESYISLIEKCSSPTGDGNSLARLIDLQSALIIEKCSSPTGDGNG